MLSFFKKAQAFLIKDLRNESSYKFAFLAQFAGILFSVLTYFFLARLIGGAASSHLQPYGGDYFSFVLVGIAFASYLQVSLRSFSSCIRDAQIFGTLEALLVTQTSVPTIIISSTLYSFFLASYRIIAYLAIGAILFGLEISNANIVGALLVLCLTILCFSCFGILSAGFIMIIKKGDPLGWIFTSLSWLLGGVYFPITILPDWVQKISWFLPITHSLQGMRLSILKGATISELLPNLIPLIIFIIILVPVSLLFFKYAVRMAKVKGSLVQY